MLRFGSHRFGSSAQIVQPTSNHLKIVGHLARTIAKLSLLTSTWRWTDSLCKKEFCRIGARDFSTAFLHAEEDSFDRIWRKLPPNSSLRKFLHHVCVCLVVPADQRQVNRGVNFLEKFEQWTSLVFVRNGRNGSVCAVVAGQYVFCVCVSAEKRSCCALPWSWEPKGEEQTTGHMGVS